MTQRIGAAERKTSESDIRVEINLDGTGKSDISTGLPFFDHMLTAFATHGSFDLTVKAHGDIEIDAYHTVEDTAIVLGALLLMPLVIRRASAALARSFCRWMKRWWKLSLIFLAARTTS